MLFLTKIILSRQILYIAVHPYSPRYIVNKSSALSNHSKGIISSNSTPCSFPVTTKYFSIIQLI